MKAAHSHSALNGHSCTSLQKHNPERYKLTRLRVTNLLDLGDRGWGVQHGCLQTGGVENPIAIQSMKLGDPSGPSPALNAWQHT